MDEEPAVCGVVVGHDTVWQWALKLGPAVPGPRRALDPLSGARPWGAAASITRSHLTPAPTLAHPSSGCTQAAVPAEVESGGGTAG